MNVMHALPAKGPGQATIWTFDSDVQVIDQNGRQIALLRNDAIDMARVVLEQFGVIYELIEAGPDGEVSHGLFLSMTGAQVKALTLGGKALTLDGGSGSDLLDRLVIRTREVSL